MIFLLFTMLSAFLICGEYAIIRPVSNSLFLTAFSSKAYPWVWLATVPINFFTIYLYNRFLPKVGPLKVFATLSAMIIGVNLITASYPHKALLFFQYAWKDIYILLLLKQLWSMIQTSIPDKAKTHYGLIYAMGTVGAIMGSFVPTLFASSLGSEFILNFTLPIQLLAVASYAIAFQYSQAPSSFEGSKAPSEAFTLIRKTPLLLAILLLVVCMQVSVGLMEYQFNAQLELNILDKDLRSAYCGQVTAWTNTICLLLQAAGGAFLIRMIGLERCHIMIPAFLLGSWVMTLFFPSFGVFSFAYIFLKAVDFSFFNIAREMLYAPLPIDAKYRAKAVIDVFAYRTSKAFMSLGILVLQAVAGAYLFSITSAIAATIFVTWLLIALYFFNKKRALV